MSLLKKNENEKKKEPFNKRKYFQEYRELNRSSLIQKQKTKYYAKTYGLGSDFVELYGEYSGDVFKVQKEFQKIRQLAPELLPHIIQLLQNDIPET